MKSLFPMLLMLIASVSPAKDKLAIAPEILSAKTVAIVAKLGPVGNGGYTPDLQRAKSQLTEALEKWGRYKVVDEVKKADILILVTEGHYGSISQANLYTNGQNTSGTVKDVAVLGDILEVFKGGSLPDKDALPLWTRVETGGYTWPAKRAIDRFKKAVQESEKQNKALSLMYFVPSVHPLLARELRQSKRLQIFFDSLPESSRQQIDHEVRDVKKEDTRLRCAQHAGAVILQDSHPCGSDHSPAASRKKLLSGKQNP
jgi:hypothetical protein